MSNSTRYPIPREMRRVTDDVKGSRFIASAGYAPDVDAAKSFIEKIKTEFPDATHNCWAYVVGPPGSTRQNGSSDDGEPGGTAGSPILNVLLNSGVGDVVVVVTRYFGGVKLGRGGLVRAYGGGAQRVLKELPLDERVFFTRMSITADYADVERIRRLIASFGGVVTEEVFATDATFKVKIPDEKTNEFENSIREITSGRADVRPPGKDNTDE